jgi:hypothetical protein
MSFDFILPYLPLDQRHARLRIIVVEHYAGAAIALIKTPAVSPPSVNDMTLRVNQAF